MHLQWCHLKCIYSQCYVAFIPNIKNNFLNTFHRPPNSRNLFSAVWFSFSLYKLITGSLYFAWPSSKKSFSKLIYMYICIYIYIFIYICICCIMHGVSKQQFLFLLPRWNWTFMFLTLKLSLRATIDHHGPFMHSGHYTASINCWKNTQLQR